MVPTLYVQERGTDREREKKVNTNMRRGMRATIVMGKKIKYPSVNIRLRGKGERVMQGNLSAGQ